MLPGYIRDHGWEENSSVETVASGGGITLRTRVCYEFGGPTQSGRSSRDSKSQPFRHKQQPLIGPRASASAMCLALCPIVLEIVFLKDPFCAMASAQSPDFRCNQGLLRDSCWSDDVLDKPFAGLDKHHQACDQEAWQQINCPGRPRH